MKNATIVLIRGFMRDETRRHRDRICPDRFGYFDFDPHGCDLARRKGARRPVRQSRSRARQLILLRAGFFAGRYFDSAQRIGEARFRTSGLERLLLTFMRRPARHP